MKFHQLFHAYPRYPGSRLPPEQGPVNFIDLQGVQHKGEFCRNKRDNPYWKDEQGGNCRNVRSWWYDETTGSEEFFQELVIDRLLIITIPPNCPLCDGSSFIKSDEYGYSDGDFFGIECNACHCSISGCDDIGDALLAWGMRAHGEHALYHR